MKDVTAQWVYPHITALAYLRYHETVFKQGAPIKELWISPIDFEIQDIKPTNEPPHADIINLVEEMLKLRQRLGSFGGYTISTLLSMLAFTDLQQRYPPVFEKEISKSMEKGFDFVEFNYFNDEVPY